MDQHEPQQTITAAAATAERPPFRYDARLANEIEARWQRRWAEQGTFRLTQPGRAAGRGIRGMAGRPKFYVLDMFPYPSGAGLHVGHPLGYIGTDVYARYLRMTGHHVLHTFGYDAFGLPAEQYAIDTGQHPPVTTRANIDNMRRQLRRLGLGPRHPPRDRDHRPRPIYRWTQWIFLQIFNSWLRRADRNRARPIADLIAEFESGQRDSAGRPGVDRPDRDRAARGRRQPPARLPRDRDRSTGARASARCWPTRRSPPTDAATSATTPSTGGRCGSGCCASPRSPTA